MHLNHFKFYRGAVGAKFRPTTYGRQQLHRPTGAERIPSEITLLEIKGSRMGTIGCWPDGYHRLVGVKLSGPEV